MQTISLEAFMKSPMKYMREAMGGNYAKVTAENGTAAILIDEIEWTMLTQALKLCMEHPEWTTES